MKDQFNYENLSTPASLEEELSRLKEATELNIKRMKEIGEMAESREAAREAIKQYMVAPPNERLQARTIKEHEVKTLIQGLSPEPHDSQVAELSRIMHEKGIKSALRVAEEMNNPHLFDDFCRYLIQFIVVESSALGIKEGDDLWRPLHMTLFEVNFPEAGDEDKNKQLKELISGMEQFYAGMLFATSDKKKPGWFSIEMANTNGSAETIFYVSTPTEYKNLFEKQLSALFPGVRAKEHRNDFNIFNESGSSVASYAKLSKHFIYPLKFYDEFNVDPLGVILNSFSKIDAEGEGAAIQFIIGPREDKLVKQAEAIIKKIREGKSVNNAIEEAERSFGGVVIKELFDIAQTLVQTEKTEEKDKKEKENKEMKIDQALLEQLLRKIKSPLVSLNIRITASAKTEMEAKNILADLESGFNQFESGRGNRIEWKRMEKKRLKKFLQDFSLRDFEKSEAIILNIEEMTTCFHFPLGYFSRIAPQLKQSKSGSAPAPLEIAKQGTLVGINNYRGEETPIYIASEDRMRHFYVVGQTGTGKTSLLKNMIVQDIRAGHGVCFIDPHGSDVMEILANVPPERYKDVIYFDPSSVERPMALNMLEFDHSRPEQKTFVVNEMFSIFRKLYGNVPESMGPMFEQYFRNATMLVIEDPHSGSTLIDVSRVMSNKEFRDMKLAKCNNPIVVQFWEEIAERAGGDSALANIVPYITSKFDVFLSNDIMRPIISQEKSSFNMRDVMDNKKILLVNLSKGRLGDINSHLIGLILVGKILMAALSRVDLFGKEMSDFYLYLDEFQNITTDSIATILSEARKYRLGLTVAHQFIGQLDEKIKNAVFGNVGSMAVFRVGAEDAEFLEKQFIPIFTRTDIVNIDNYNAYLRILSGGRSIKPFNIRCLPPEKGSFEQAETLKQLSSITYGRDRQEIDKEVMDKYLNRDSF